jgi:hypothetical protein
MQAFENTVTIQKPAGEVFARAGATMLVNSVELGASPAMLKLLAPAATPGSRRRWRRTSAS